MHKKIGPIILLVALLLIVVFIIGTRYGTRVGAQNKVIDYVLSITPTPSPLPTSSLNYKSFQHKGCGMKFLQPDSLKAEKNSSTEATLVDGETTVMIFSCEKNNVIQAIIVDPDPTLATSEVQLKTQKIKARTDTTDSTNTLYFQMRNPLNGKQIYVGINKNLFPLFQSTLEFTR